MVQARDEAMMLLEMERVDRMEEKSTDMMLN